MKRTLLVLPCALAACSPAPAAPGDEAATPASPYAFDLNLTLTTRAAEQLARAGERVIVNAMY